MSVSLLIALDATALYNVTAGTDLIKVLSCAGTEPRVIDCTLFKANYFYPCSHSDDVGVRCPTRSPSTGEYMCMCGKILDMLSSVSIKWVITQLT